MSAFILSGLNPWTGTPVHLTIAKGRIAAIEPAPHADNLPWLAPGVVDLQVNGYAGHDMNGPGLEPATVSALARALLDVGVTRFVPTLITGPEATITGNLRAIAQARASDRVVQAMVPYVHIEGPHIASLDGPRGAHPRSAVRACDLAEFGRWQEAAQGLVGMVTLCPASPGAMSYIAALADRGVHVAIGHSDAAPERIHEAARAGARLSTHLGNGMAAMLPRHPNLLWAQLANDRLTATFIADGHHLPADTLRAMIRAKGIERSLLVSDCVALGGLAPGRYQSPIGGEVELGTDGRLSLAGTPYLAGAARPLIDGIAIAMRDVGLKLADALRLATANPARFAGGGGTLTVGERADIIRFRLSPDNSRLTLDGCWLGGQPTSAL